MLGSNPLKPKLLVGGLGVLLLLLLLLLLLDCTITITIELPLLLLLLLLLPLLLPEPAALPEGRSPQISGSLRTKPEGDQTTPSRSADERGKPLGGKERRIMVPKSIRKKERKDQTWLKDNLSAKLTEFG